MNSGALILAACWLACLAAAAAAPDAFTFATYNINYNNRSLSNVANNVRQTRADFVGLQETNPESERFLRKALAREYPHQEYHAGELPSTGLALLARRPLPKAKYLPPRHGAYGALLAEVPMLTGTAQVMVVHLQSPRFQNARSPLDLVRAVSAMEEIHAREITDRFRQLDTNRPAIILGDLNSLSEGNAPRFLRERRWVDSLAAAHPQADRVPTWRDITMGQELQLRIDYLFHTPDLETSDCRVLPLPGSDHFPVVSRLRWKATGR